MKKVVIAILIVLIIIAGIFLLNKPDDYEGIYQIYIEKIDDLSPDRHLVVKRDGKVTNKYKHIIYKNGDTKAILCYSDNPIANVFSLDVDELTIVLPNDKEKVAKLIKEEK